jgi:FlaA1/EpsC-like NDP-sugar epimerase
MEEDGVKGSLIVDLNSRLEALVDALVPVRRGLVFASTVFTVAISFMLAFYLRHEFTFATPEAEFIPRVLLVVLLLKLIVFYAFRLYEGMWRYVSIADLWRILLANIVGSSGVIAAVAFGRPYFAPGFSLTVLVIDAMLCFLAMSGKRVLTRVIREAASKASGQRDVRTIILGGLDSLNVFIQALNAAPSRHVIIGVLTDDMKTGHSIRGVPVLGKTTSAAKCAKKHNASEILLLPPYSTPSTIKVILEDLERRGKKCALRMVPSYADIADGKIDVSHVKEVEIEDLLGRKPVRLDREDVAKFVKDRSIMVTGAGGSIGRELCLQLAAYAPAKLVLFELSEFNLYAIMDEIRTARPDVEALGIMGDVREMSDLDAAIANNGVNTIFHAAAYKHVPLMEENPVMALRTNSLGTANLADAAERNAVERVVVISTDKAVNPTSVMGATKRVAERIVLERINNKTEFVVVRFGNVLGSSGSVIPRFKRQLKEGGPLTVTSKDVVRYFMSIPEAVDLLLQAGAVGDDRDIMVLEMGEPVRIYDMARKLIELSGLEPDKDIEMKIIGMRPGEKEFEELLTDDERVDKTPYDRIYVGKKRSGDSDPVDLTELRKLVSSKDIREALRRLVPENQFDSAA